VIIIRLSPTTGFFKAGEVALRCKGDHMQVILTWWGTKEEAISTVLGNGSEGHFTRNENLTNNSMSETGGEAQKMVL
jgi:hypothetical protein